MVELLVLLAAALVVLGVVGVGVALVGLEAVGEFFRGRTAGLESEGDLAEREPEN